jgi:hypothetical protein
MALHNTVCFKLSLSNSWSISNSISKTALSKFQEELKIKGFEFLSSGLDKEKLAWELKFKFEGKSDELSEEKLMLYSIHCIDGMRNGGYRLITSTSILMQGQKPNLLLWFELDPSQKQFDLELQ